MYKRNGKCQDCLLRKKINYMIPSNLRLLMSFKDMHCQCKLIAH